jgi:hypothetical protein
MKILLSILASIGLTMGIAGCTIVVPNDTSINTAATVSSGQSKTPGAASTHKWGARTKTSSCKASNGLQDAACTPGDILPDATKDMICVPGYSKSVRNVPASVKDDAYASYSIASRAAGEYEVDHLVSLELGGSNDISNLWPELASPKPGFHEKDKVENWLHDHVCSGAMSLQDAQIMIATDWHQALNKMP